jgi:20S proteasome alpha/beta subunit
MMNSKDSKMTEYQTVVNSIMFGNFTTEQLTCIGQALQHAKAQLGHQVKRELRIGSAVKFTDSRKGRTFTGIVVAIKRKNVVVLTKRQDNPGLAFDTRYNVPAQLIEVAA